MSGTGKHQALAEILSWWVLTAGVWLATLTSFTAAETSVAVACTLPCAVAARTARRANRGHWRFRIGWLRWIATVLRDIPVQTVQVWAYALTPRRRGVFSMVALPSEPESVAKARRAAVVVAFAATPGTVVVDCDSRDGTVLLHRVRPGPGQLATMVQR